MKLVFVHGAGESSLSFYYQLRHFRNSKAIDLPGHPTGTPCSNIDGYVEWVRGFNTARRYKNVVLCGHSMGGAIALQHAMRYPEELKGIILIGSGARLRVHPNHLNLCKQPGAEDAMWLEGRRKSYKDVEPDIHQVLMRRAEEVGPGVELNDLQACDRFDVMESIESIRLPVQVICGNNDTMTPVKYSDYMTHMIKGARQEVIDGGSHYVQLEKYQKVNEQIEKFLAALR